MCKKSKSPPFLYYKNQGPDLHRAMLIMLMIITALRVILRKMLSGSCRSGKDHWTKARRTKCSWKCLIQGKYHIFKRWLSNHFFKRCWKCSIIGNHSHWQSEHNLLSKVIVEHAKCTQCNPIRFWRRRSTRLTSSTSTLIHNSAGVLSTSFRWKYINMYQT